MAYRVILAWLFVVVLAKPNDEEEFCKKINCIGEGYLCVENRCYCAEGYTLNSFQNRCIRCPGKGEKCYSFCCDYYGYAALTCWQGVCQTCYDDQGKFICREPFDHIFLVSTTQVAMATALVLGIVATFILLYKLCAASNISPLGTGSNYESRPSLGSLQFYIDERLRDAPPRYSRTAPSGVTTAVIPATVYLNAGFIHDCSVPPPPYTPQKDEDVDKETNDSQPAIALHI